MAIAYVDPELEGIRETLVRGRVEETLPRLRELLKRKLAKETSHRKTTPSLSFADETETESGDCLETLFAFALWEALNNDYIAADIQLLEQTIMETTKGPLPFRVGAAWLALKCRPGATKDELNDAQQLLDRYLLQIAREAPPSAEISEKLRAKYAFLVELLTLRVYPAQNLFESSQSFLAKEHVREDLLLESDRECFVELLKTMLPSSKKDEQPVNSAPTSDAPPNAPPPAASPSLPRPAVATTSQTSTSLASQQMVEEFQRRNRQVEEDEQMMMIKSVAITAGAAFIIALES